MKLSLGMPMGIGRNPQPLETENQYEEDQDIVDTDLEPITQRRPVVAGAATEEISQVREVRKRREPKIVPPKNGEEMLRKRQEQVRARTPERQANAEALRLPIRIKNTISTLESIEDEIDHPGIALSQSLTVEYIQRLTDTREELESLVARVRKLDATHDLSLELIDMNMALRRSEDLLHSLHTSLQQG